MMLQDNVMAFPCDIAEFMYMYPLCLTIRFVYNNYIIVWCNT